ATHTHLAPMSDATKPRLGRIDEDWYQDLVSKLVKEIVKLVNAAGKACYLSTAAGRVSGAIHRRRYVRRPIIHRRRITCGVISMGPDPNGPRNDHARLAVFADESSAPIAALVTWACHPASRPIRDQVSSEFIGFVRDGLRRKLGPIPIVFLQGFSGDVRAD